MPAGISTIIRLAIPPKEVSIRDSLEYFFFRNPFINIFRNFFRNLRTRVFQKGLFLIVLPKLIFRDSSMSSSYSSEISFRGSCWNSYKDSFLNCFCGSVTNICWDYIIDSFIGQSIKKSRNPCSIWIYLLRFIGELLEYFVKWFPETISGRILQEILEIPLQEFLEECHGEILEKLGKLLRE